MRTDFGPNTWLVEEMYRKYQEDPSSVSDSWQEFFADYRPKGSATEAKPETPAASAAKPKATESVPGAEPLKGPGKVIAERMGESLTVPTATSFRTVPAKLLEVNREILNRHLLRNQWGKVSFTHLIGFAVARALAEMPGMNVTYAEVDGKPHVVRHEHVVLGLAVDVKRDDGTRTLLVPNIKDADTLDFAAFHRAYEALIRKVTENALSPDDFAGTTVTITNPGMIGTVQSVPRLMAGQAAIIGVGAIDHSAEYRGSDPETLAELGIGKVLNLTSTYDHRVIQGAESGEFLRRVEHLLLGEEEFYENVFRAMHVPYVPVRWHADDKPTADSIEGLEKQARVFQLINMYRVRGHLIANLDPLEAEPPTMHPELDPASYGFTIWDLDRRFATGGLGDEPVLELRHILGILRDAYCRTATVEYMHIEDPIQKRWVQERVEGVSTHLAPEEQRHILSKLNEAEVFEHFLQTRFVGHKRFSLEGAESLIPMLDTMLDLAADEGLAEAVVGMSHRGRLDVLTSTVGKSYGQVFRQFEGDLDPDLAYGSGDVKYHIGAAGKHTSRAGNQVVVSVTSNPSHLEAVDPVVEGIVRAKQDRLGRDDYSVLPLLLHGDAAFAGQGVVAETLNLSQLEGYRTGGTVHVIVNNQLGFTTGSDYARSTTYASDVAKMVQAPIFHVNGDNPEAVVHVAKIATEFRQKFQKPVVIDMFCYRRYGHNEADDPSFTQPLMYDRINELRTVRKRYMEVLVNRGDLSVEEAEEAMKEFRRKLDEAFDDTAQTQKPKREVTLEPREPGRPAPPVATGVPQHALDEVLEVITSVPDGFQVHEKLGKWLEERKKSLVEDRIDWPLAEQLAWGTLLREGVTVRLSGQDSRRGTFSQRHSVLVDQQTGEEYTPLAQVGSGRFITLDSLLSEFAAVGFEYGYSVGDPEALVMWEAQFGDFVNGAQVVIDQFVSAGEDKWGQTSGLVLLLPHGFEGQGPEHSSARLERFLQLAAQDNIEVVVPSTPAQCFHLLRRQVIRDRRKPLIAFTPKSLLRLPAARSSTEELTEGAFREVLPDPSPPSDVRRVILCQGKLYYELARHREKEATGGAALVRVEGCYPFPGDAIREQLDRFPGAEVVWAQEEPENQGAWRFMDSHLRGMGVEARRVSRPESAAPATGSLTIHRREQGALITRAFEAL